MGDLKFEFTNLKVQESVGSLTLNRPPVNVINIPMLRELIEALEVAAGESELKVLQLRAEGKLFSAGVDVLDHTADRAEEMIALVEQVCVSLAEFPVPTIAVVHGHALGGGCELVLCCDMAWMAEGATIGQPEIKLSALAPLATLLLPPAIGPRWAAQMLFTGEAVDAKTAEEIGLVNAAVPPGDLDRTVAEVTAQLSSLSSAASRLNKKSYLVVTRGWKSTMKEINEIYLKELMALEDAQEGLEAFMEKREPVWQNK